MALRYRQNQIDALMREPKVPLLGECRSPRLLPKGPHRQATLPLQGADGNRFALVIRSHLREPGNFSVIVAVRTSCAALGRAGIATPEVFRLCRYNGNSHAHANLIEGDTFRDFHIHRATERYQRTGRRREDGFAAPSQRFHDLNGAVRCAVEDANIRLPVDVLDIMGGGG